MPGLKARIARARALLGTVRHGAIATVNEDGSPHNSPVFMAFDERLNTYWASHPDARHSRNIARTGQVFIVIFDGVDAGGGLYMRATARELGAEELEPGLTVFNTKRRELLREEVPAAYFTGSQSQRLYIAVPDRFWVNMAQKDAAGHIIYDKRYQILSEDLGG
nr:pyridoxamine 5'-phosphate oxidase [uncultured bacterium]